MSIEHWVPLISASISFVGLLLVVIQLRATINQRRIESLLQINAINRDIISLGFSHPELFQILHGKRGDPLIEQHYLQLWFNQLELLHGFHKRRMFEPDAFDGHVRDIKYFLSQDNALRHWEKTRQYYPASFQAFVDQIAGLKTGGTKARPSRKFRFKRR